MLSLSGYRRNMSFISGSLFLGRGVGIDPAVTAVIADMVDLALVDPGVVNVVDRVDVHVIHSCVVVKMPVVPASALVTMTEITEAIVDPAIETDERAPVAWIEKIAAAPPTPITRSP
jgi:predicted RNA methylase